MFTTPNWLFDTLKIIVYITLAILFANLIWYTALSLIALRKPKKDYPMVADKHRFLFVIPAHNEEAVIRATLESMIAQNYQKDLYRIALIADNCTDKTAEIGAEYADIIVFENTSERTEPRGKPHALSKFFHQNQEWKEFDFISFIDADNIVHPDYLREMNAQVCANPELTAVQGYLGVKNLTTSITASGYGAVYFITNRAVQYGKHLLGWNAAIGGTGFILSVDYLTVHGWNPRSYTEDFELQVELSIQGKKSTWNHYAKVYDEKPNSFMASHRQRTRWAQGHWLVGITTTFQQLKSIFSARSFVRCMSSIETLFYSYSMIRPIVYVYIILQGLIDKRLFAYFPPLFSLVTFWLVIEAINFLLVPIVYLTSEGHHYFSKRGGWFQKIVLYFRLIIGFIWNSLTYLIAQFIGFCTWFRPQNKWRKTAHSAAFEKE